jgi:hypothetical protein
VSVSTANRGYIELESHGLMTSRFRKVKDALSADGVQRKLMRRLAGDFAKPVRKPSGAKLIIPADISDFPKKPRLRAV